ncbi:MAG: hypothetical protein WAN11_22610 [Syntrophobacteraceae bacterium]
MKSFLFQFISGVEHLFASSAVLLNMVLRACRLIGPADVYCDCASEWRYPSYLIRALRLAGATTIEVPSHDARSMLRIDGLGNFMRRVRVIRDGATPTAPTIITVHPDRSYGSSCTVIRVSIDYFSDDDRATGMVMPYFIHPELWRFKREFERQSMNLRPLRIGFAGTINSEAYRRAFEFPMMNRTEIFDTINSRLADRISVARSRSELDAIGKKPSPIVIVPVEEVRDTTTKHILRGRKYIDFLGRCAFFIAAPGWAMPFSHSLIESMALGTIPILNYANYLYPPLLNGENCLTFTTPTDLCDTIDRAIMMSENEIARLRSGVTRYFSENLSVGSFALRLRQKLDSNLTLVVNAEHLSAALWQSRCCGGEKTAQGEG